MLPLRPLLAAPADPEPEEVEALVDVGDPRFVLRQAKAHGREHRREFPEDRIGVITGSGHQHDEVVRVADESGRWLLRGDGAGSGRFGIRPDLQRSAKCSSSCDRAMLASSGERIPPWGVPVIVSSCRPCSVSTPALRNALTSATTACR
jgi:hypothetical protein